MIEQPRLTRDLINRLPSRTDERGPIGMDDPAPDYHQQTAESILSHLDRSGSLWVFAAGSLMWNPRFKVVEQRTASVQGWHRSFCLYDTRYRGSPSAPGLMMSLVPGGACFGTALRMASEDMFTTLVNLLESEPPIPPAHAVAWTDAGPVQSILFAADPTSLLYRPEPDDETLADILASAVGHVGTMADYLLRTLSELVDRGIHDPHLWNLQRLVAERLERLPAQHIQAHLAKMSPTFERGRSEDVQRSYPRVGLEIR